jgi:hypothetical protein
VSRRVVLDSISSHPHEVRVRGQPWSRRGPAPAGGVDVLEELPLKVPSVQYLLTDANLPVRFDTLFWSWPRAGGRRCNAPPIRRRTASLQGASCAPDLQLVAATGVSPQ